MATAVIAWIAIGLTAVSTVVSLRQMDKAKKKANRQSYTYGEGALTTSTSNTTPVPLIYGKVRVAGNQIYSRLTNSDKTIMKVIALCEGPVGSITNLKIDDLPPSSGKFEGVSYSIYRGLDGQSIDGRVVGGSQEERAERVGGLRNIAYVALQADANENLNGSFNVSMDVEGSMVDVYTTPTEKVNMYSNNPAWCILDFMTRYNGCGMNVKDVDIQSFIDAAKYFEDNNYTLNMCLDQQKSRLEWINDMMDCCRSNLVYHNGKYAIQVEKAEETVQYFDEDSIHDLTVWFSPLEEVPDIYRVTYIDPNNEWVKVQAEASRPPSTYLRKQPMISEIELLGVTNFDQASRLAWFYLNQALTCQTYVEFKTDQRALDRTVGDVIELTDYITEFQHKKFRITKIEDAQDDSIKLTCREYIDDIYMEHRYETLPVINITKLDYSSQPPPNISYITNTQYYNLNDDGSITSDITLNIDYDDFFYGSYFKVSFRKVGEETWSSAGIFDYGVKSFTLHNMEVFATYEFRFQNVSKSRLVSEYTYSPSIYIKGNSNVPLPPANFVATRTYGGIKLSWEKVTNISYRIYSINDGIEELLVETTESPFIYFVTDGIYNFKIYAVNNLGYISQPSSCSYSLQRPEVTEIKASNRYRECVDGVPKYDILVTWTPPEEKYYKRAEVWYKTSNEQAEYLALVEGDIPADELNLYTGEWISAGYGSSSVILSQAIVGDKYLIAVCAQDEYGGTDKPDDCPKIEHTVTIKAEIPNTPDNFSVKFTDVCTASWDEVINSDILYYELRTNSNFGDNDGLIIKTTETKASIPLTSRSGYLYVYAVSTSLKHSAGAKVFYIKNKPKAPEIIVNADTYGTLILNNNEVPVDCTGIHYILNGARNSYSDTFKSISNVIGVKPDIYQINACFVDMFGEGDYSSPVTITVNPWIDGNLLKEASVVTGALDSATQQAIKKAEESITSKEVDDKLSEYTVDVVKREATNAAGNAVANIDWDTKLNPYYLKADGEEYINNVIGDIIDNTVNDALKDFDISDSLRNYVKVADLENGILTVMADKKILNGKNELNLYTKQETNNAINTTLLSQKIIKAGTGTSYVSNVYTKDETSDLITTSLSSYTSTEGLEDAIKGVSNLTNYYTKSEAPTQVKTTLASIGLINGSNDTRLNVYTKQETDSLVETSIQEGIAKEILLEGTRESGKIVAIDARDVGKTLKLSSSTLGKVVYFNVSAGDVYTITYQTSNDTTAREYIFLVDDKLKIIANEKDSSSSAKYELKQKTVTVPLGVTKIYVHSWVNSILDADPIEIKFVANLSNYSTVKQTSDSITTALGNFSSNLSNTYATKDSVSSNGVEIEKLATAVGKDASGNYTTVSSRVSTALSTAKGYTDTSISNYDTNTISKTYATLTNLNETEANVTSILSSYTKGDGFIIPSEKIKAKRDGYDLGDKVVTINSNYWWTCLYNVKEDEVYEITLQLDNTDYIYVVFTDANDRYVAKAVTSNGGRFISTPSSILYDVVTDYIKVPEGATKMYVTSRANSNADEQACEASIKVKKAGREYSSIAQLSNGIQLSVAGGSGQSSINLSEKTLTLDTDLLRIGREGSLTTIEDGAITTDMLKSGSITTDKLFSGTIDLQDSLNIRGGSVILDKDGLTCSTTEGNSVTFDTNGMSFKDKNGVTYSSVGRMSIGTAKHGQKVVFDTPWDRVPNVICMPQEFQSSYNGYDSTNLKVVAYASDITENGFKVNCYTTLLSGTSGSQAGFTIGSFSGNRDNMYWEGNYNVTVGEAVLNLPSTASHADFSVSYSNTTPKEEGYRTEDGDVPLDIIGYSSLQIIVYVNGVEYQRFQGATATGYSGVSGTANFSVDFNPGSSVKIAVYLHYHLNYQFYYHTRMLNASASVSYLNYNVTSPQIIGTGIATFIVLENTNGRVMVVDG